MKSCEILQAVAKDYSAYLKWDVANGFNTVQDVVDNMLTRLEELTSVLQMIKLKNSDCSTAVSDDISKYKSEISVLSKKIVLLNNILQILHSNVDKLEKQVEKAEFDFGVNTDGKIKSLLRPFLKRNKVLTPSNVHPINKIYLETVMHNFEEASH